MDKADFEVRGPDGRVWKIYADGRTEGFPDGSVIFNRLPIYARRVGGMVMDESYSAEFVRLGCPEAESCRQIIGTRLLKADRPDIVGGQSWRS